MTNRKTTLVLATFACLAGALLPPTSASAAFRHSNFGKHTAKPVGGHPGNTAHRFGSRRPLWKPVVHARVAHGPIHALHRPVFRRNVAQHFIRPVWARPVVVQRVSHPVYQEPVRVVTRPAYQPVHTVTHSASSQVNGQNVVLVAVPNGQYSMTEAGHWAREVNNGQHFEFTEAGRDEWSVYLNDASRGLKLQLDLREKKVFQLIAAEKKAIFPIVSFSAQ